MHCFLVFYVEYIVYKFLIYGLYAMGVNFKTNPLVILSLKTLVKSIFNKLFRSL